MNICGAKYGARPWPDSTCHLRPNHYGDHEAEAWDLGGTIRWTERTPREAVSHAVASLPWTPKGKP